jgi:hypothetical protein
MTMIPNRDLLNNILLIVHKLVHYIITSFLVIEYYLSLVAYNQEEHFFVNA